jgi:phosphate transport system permease protein
MAALPSVVVGSLAALFLAPLIEKNLIAAGLTLLAVPVFAVLAAPLWQMLPSRLRDRLPDGVEPAMALPLIAVGALAAIALAPLVESAWFGGDVRQWLFVEQGIRFDPRNNIVVGVALGVAVIPIIFTVSEDALSNVPASLVSGALALGASRWQATWRIVLRAASPGIFAAVMLGFGRAVGETMIVLMATGNTPIMDWSIFNGMRTMSAAIAVEIPEAPHGGTLYRVLFVTAFLLFLFTLAVNTVATLVSSRLRRRFGRF